MEFTILGRVPSKKNSKQIFARQGRIIAIPSAKHKEWHTDASKQILGTYKKGIKAADIFITLYAPDARKGDLTNKAESVMDLLVDNGVLEDDNWFVCGDVRLKFGGIDKENPRVDIKIDVL